MPKKPMGCPIMPYRTIFVSLLWWINPWWRHQMETFSALLAIWAGNSPVPGEFLTQKPVTRSFDVYFYLCPNKRLSKHSWGWWIETPSRPLIRHRNVCIMWLMWAGRCNVRVTEGVLLEALDRWISKYFNHSSAILPREPIHESFCVQ